MMRCTVTPAAPRTAASAPSDDTTISTGDQEWLTTRSLSSAVTGSISHGRELCVKTAEDHDWQVQDVEKSRKRHTHGSPGSLQHKNRRGVARVRTPNEVCHRAGGATQGSPRADRQPGGFEHRLLARHTLEAPTTTAAAGHASRIHAHVAEFTT